MEHPGFMLLLIIALFALCWWVVSRLSNACFNIPSRTVWRSE